MSRNAKTVSLVMTAAALLLLCLVASPQTYAADALVVEQKAVAQRFLEVERRLLEMAAGLETTDPSRSRHLLEAAALARREFIADRMARIGELLSAERYAEAIELEQETLAALYALMEALGARQWGEDLERLEGLAQELDRLIQRQRRAAEHLAGAPAQELPGLAGEQESVRRDTERLRAQVQGACADPLGRVASSMQSASSSMKAAAQDLKAGEREDALLHQQDATRALEAARSRLQEVIARSRAERNRELVRRLVAALRRTLGRQEAISRDTVELDARLGAGAQLGRAEHLEVHALAERERGLEAELREAARMLGREEVGSVLSCVLACLGDDAAEVARRLDELHTGATTQQLQRALEDSLREVIAALEGKKDPSALDAVQAERRRGPEGREEFALIPAVAQLKLLRALQWNVNRRTERLDASRGGTGLLPAEAAPELALLRRRQAEIRKMAGSLQRAIAIRAEQ